jgi:hypothetical protein
VQIEAGRPRAEQQAAFTHRDVRAIVDALQAQRFDTRLLQVARQAVISPDPASAAELSAELRLAVDDPLVQAGLTIAQAGARIAREPDPDLQGRRWGAVLERLIWAMCSSRKPAETSREDHVVVIPNKHLNDRRTGRMDVLVNSAPFEAYECKFPAKIYQSDIDELGAIFLTAEAEGLDSRPCVATWGSRKRLDLWIKDQGIKLDERLYYVDEEELLLNVVRDRPPSARLR